MIVTINHPTMYSYNQAINIYTIALAKQTTYNYGLEAKLSLSIANKHGYKILNKTWRLNRKMWTSEEMTRWLGKAGHQEGDLLPRPPYLYWKQRWRKMMQPLLHWANSTQKISFRQVCSTIWCFHIRHLALQRLILVPNTSINTLLLIGSLRQKSIIEYTCNYHFW